ncbi:MAG: hypothetical protein QF535_01095 [Anaerolineales bacterium]|nr:hypothetical protein [Anaerolineales bacterium]
MSSPYVAATDVTYHFKFLPTKNIGSSGKIEIIFPSNYVDSDLNGGSVCKGL